jgi:poly(A) polymerase
MGNEPSILVLFDNDQLRRIIQQRACGLVKIKLVEVETKDHIRNFQPPISGELIMQYFGLLPCREVGTIKNAIKDAILDGLIANDYDEAHDYMIAQGTKLGLERSPLFDPS